MNIGFIGLGAMGQVIVPRMLAAGHAVAGWNRSSERAKPLLEKGMRWADTPRAVAAASDVRPLAKEPSCLSNSASVIVN